MTQSLLDKVDLLMLMEGAQTQRLKGGFAHTTGADLVRALSVLSKRASGSALHVPGKVPTGQGVHPQSAADHALGVTCAEMEAMAVRAVQSQSMAEIAAESARICAHARLPSTDLALPPCPWQEDRLTAVFTSAHAGDLLSLAQLVTALPPEQLQAPALVRGTLWHQAATCPGTAEIFIRAQADPTLRNRFGQTVLDCALMASNLSDAQQLMISGLAPTQTLEVHAWSIIEEIETRARCMLRPCSPTRRARALRRAKIQSDCEGLGKTLMEICRLGADPKRAVFVPSRQGVFSLSQTTDTALWCSPVLRDMSQELTHWLTVLPSVSRKISCP